MKKIAQIISLVLILLTCSIAFAEIIIKGEIPQTYKEGAYKLDNFADDYNSGKITIIDVRSAQEYEMAHLEGAIHLPIDSSTFAQDLAQLQNYEHSILFCALGKRAARAYSILKKNYPELLNKVHFLDAKSNFKANGDLSITPN